MPAKEILFDEEARRVLEEGAGLGPPLELAALFNNLLAPAGFPEKGPSVGQSWQSDAQVDFIGIGKFGFSSTSTLEAIKTFEGQECAEIHSVVTFPLGEYVVAETKARHPDRKTVRSAGMQEFTITGLFTIEQGHIIRQKMLYTAALKFEYPPDTPGSGESQIIGEVDVNVKRD